MGMRQEFAYNLSYEYQQLTAGARFAFYFIRYLGVEGDYRHYFASTPNNTGFTLSGDRLEAGSFSTYSVFRLYGDYFWEPDYLVGGVLLDSDQQRFQHRFQAFPLKTNPLPFCIKRKRVVFKIGTPEDWVVDYNPGRP